MNPEDHFGEHTDTKTTTCRLALILFCVILGIGVVRIIPWQRFPWPEAHRGGRAVQTATLNNAKQVGTFLQLFAQDHGTYPSLVTAEGLRAQGLEIPPGQSSNALLAQLILADYTDSEEIFAAPGTHSPYDHNPDGVISPPSEALAPGECGFAYLTQADGIAFSPADPAGTPILIDAYKPGASHFEPDLRERRIIYLRLDQSADLAAADSHPAFPDAKLDRLDSQARVPVTLPDGTKTFLFAKTNPLWKTGLPFLLQPLPR